MMNKKAKSVKRWENAEIIISSGELSGCPPATLLLSIQDMPAKRFLELSEKLIEIVREQGKKDKLFSANACGKSLIKKGCFGSELMDLVKWGNKNVKPFDKNQTEYISRRLGIAIEFAKQQQKLATLEGVKKLHRKTFGEFPESDCIEAENELYEATGYTSYNSTTGETKRVSKEQHEKELKSEKCWFCEAIRKQIAECEKRLKS